jgi:hypothetical protein
LICMKKTSNTDYYFIGSGIIDRAVNRSKLGAREKMLCIKNNITEKSPSCN